MKQICKKCNSSAIKAVDGVNNFATCNKNSGGVAGNLGKPNINISEHLTHIRIHLRFTDENEVS